MVSDQHADLRMQCLNIALQSKVGPTSTLEIAERYFNWVVSGIDINKLSKEAMPETSPRQINS